MSLDLVIMFFTTTKMSRNVLGLLVASLLTAHDFIATISSQAADEITIQAVLTNPIAYQLHVVSLKGTAMDVQPMAPAIGGEESPCLIVGSGTFILDDGTASLRVGIPGACSPGVAALPKEGDRVIVQAVIHVHEIQSSIRVEALARAIYLVDRASKN
jgi:hypothetical protein